MSKRDSIVEREVLGEDLSSQEPRQDLFPMYISCSSSTRSITIQHAT
jgi:hypothetical protein